MDSDITRQLHTTAINTSEALHSAMLNARETCSIHHWACWVQSGLVVDMNGPVVKRVLVVSDPPKDKVNELKVDSR